MSDARIARTSKSSKQTVNTRSTRASQQREVTQDRETTDAVRLHAFQMMHSQAALPDLPPIPGYHVCWLTTGNTRDSLQARERLGYEPIKISEAKGFENAVGKAGTPLDGLVHVNEMVAYKLPLRLYNAYMQEAHHFAPAREDEKLTDASERVKEELERRGSRAVTGDGVEALRELDSVAVPTYED